MEKIRLHRHLTQISICCLDIDTQLNSIKTEWMKIVIKSHKYSLERFHAVSTELNSNQGLTFFKQKLILRSKRHFIQLLT